MFYLFRTYVEANVLCCKCCMTRRGEWARTEVVPSDTLAPTCMHRRMPTATAGGAGLVGAQRQRQLCVDRCGSSVPAGGRELHAYVVGLAQPKWEAKARCTCPFRWPNASRKVRRLRCFLPHAEEVRQTCGWTVGVGVRTLVFPTFFL